MARFVQWCGFLGNGSCSQLSTLQLLLLVTIASVAVLSAWALTRLAAFVIFLGSIGAGMNAASASRGPAPNAGTGKRLEEDSSKRDGS